VPRLCPRFIRRTAITSNRHSGGLAPILSHFFFDASDEGLRLSFLLAHAGNHQVRRG
jgi:hypothetical protein